MGHYYARGRCLECQWIIGELPRCTHCGLVQSGPEADRIRQLLTDANTALQAQRAYSAVGQQGAPPPAGPSGYWPAPPAVPAPPPLLPPLRPLPVRTTGPRLTTPTILLGLGAICVLVAAVVFVSVAWSGLSLGTKSLILLTVTAGIGAVAAAVTRRGLRGSSEALTLLASALVVLDFAAAYSAGLFGLDAISDDRALAVAAILAVAVGLGWARFALFTRTRLLVGVQLLALLGVWRLVLLGYEAHWTRIEYVAFAFVVILAVSAFMAARLALWTFAVLVAVFAVVNVAIALGSSFVRVAMEDTLAGIWSTGRVIGAVACLLIFWLVALSPRIPMAWRSGAAALVVVGASFVLLRPLDGSGYDAIVATAVALFAVLAAATLVTRNPWRRGLRIGSVPTGLFAATLIGPSVLNALGTSLTPALVPWSMSPAEHPDSELVLLEGIGSAWLIAVAGFILMVSTEVVLTRRLPQRVPVLAMAAAAIAVGVLRHSLPLWAIVATLAVLGLATGALAISSRSQWVGLLAAAFGGLSFAAALGSDVLTAVLAMTFVVVLAGLAWRWPGRDEAILAAATSVLFGGFAAVALLYHADAVDSWASYVVVGIGAGVMLIAQYRRSERILVVRPGLEVGGMSLAFVAVGFAAAFDPSEQLPIVLTLAGAVFVAVALLSEDRRLVSVAGGVLLIAASWVRLQAVGVTAVEAYTLPTGLVLLTLGVIRMLRKPGSASIPILLPGLSLCLLPSLWVAVSEPTSVRALLLGGAATAILIAGAYLRWIAPLLVGAGVVLVLAIVNLSPYADAVPRWVLFALLGAGLLFLGVTWEKRLRDARTLIAAVERLA